MRRTLIDLLRRDISHDPAAALNGEDSHDLFSLWLFPAGSEPSIPVHFRDLAVERPSRNVHEGDGPLGR